MKNKSSNHIRVGITMGDPSGVGPEIAAFAMEALKGLAEFVVVGDRWVFDKVARSPAWPAGRQGRKVRGFTFVDLKNVDCKTFKFGQVKAEYGRASLEYLDKAMELIKKKKLDCLVTCPISKEAINLAGFRYSGHTEYFADKTHTRDCVMMLVNKDIAFSLVTRHIPLHEVAQRLDTTTITKTVELTAQAFKELFAIPKPRLVVCGINPHGSDNGVIGTEENSIIKPAVGALRKKIPVLDGPLGADVAIAKAKHNEYDCVIAMYHDQALIPLKLLGDETGVNITLGLGFVRTSPLHGTAFDIAGKGRARPASLIAAIKLALECVRNQKRV